MGRRYANPGGVLHDLGPADLIWGSWDISRECIGQSGRHGCPHDTGLLCESRLDSVLPPCRRSLLEPLLDSAKPDLLRAIRQWPIQRILRRRSRLPEHYGLNQFSAERDRSRPQRAGERTIEFPAASHAGGITHYATGFLKLIEEAVQETAD